MGTQCQIGSVVGRYGHLSFDVDDAGRQTVLGVVDVLAFGAARFTQDLIQSNMQDDENLFILLWPLCVSHIFPSRFKRESERALPGL